MAIKINISIPQPCHENWQAMTPVEKGKFCNSCQKKVFDFTSSSDREIVKAFQQNQNLCGRFLDTQLNRDLVKPQEKNSIWLATTSAVISFIGLGTHEVAAQEPVKTEQRDKMILDKFMITQPKEVKIEGQMIIDYENPNYEDVEILVFEKNKIYKPDIHGCFSFTADVNEHLVFSKKGFDNRDFIVKDLPGFCHIELVQDNCRTVTTGGICIIRKHTFFGRIFHSIGNWFK